MGRLDPAQPVSQTFQRPQGGSQKCPFACEHPRQIAAQRFYHQDHKSEEQQELQEAHGVHVVTLHSSGLQSLWLQERVAQIEQQNNCHQPVEQILGVHTNLPAL